MSSASAAPPRANERQPVKPGIDWAGVAADLDASGMAIVPGLLSAPTCDELVACYDDDGLFRSHIHMARHGFGRGEYKYFAAPLPETVARLRSTLYAGLAPIANRWAEALGSPQRFSDTLEGLLARCHASGQTRPTPLLLRYGPGDYNCLHQDIYGDLVFPLQVAILLAEPGVEFGGGELVLTEQRPRMQSRVTVAPLRKGDAVAFPVHHRPVQGTRGVYRVNMRHGVSVVTRGRRHTLGIIFHDAK